MTALFLVTTVATSVTGFMFPVEAFGPPEIIGVISSAGAGRGDSRAVRVQAGRLMALGLRGLRDVRAVFECLRRSWCRPFRRCRSSTRWRRPRRNPPFAVAQGILLIVFIGLGILAAKKFRPAAPRAAVA